MLRDKLHLLSAQVVEAKERIAELEAMREGKIERVGQYLVVCVALGSLYHSRNESRSARRKAGQEGGGKRAETG